MSALILSFDSEWEKDMKSFDQREDRRITIVPKNERFGAFGSELLLLPSGTLLCSYGRADFERAVHQQVISASTDRGRTWGEPRVVDEQPGLVKTMRGCSLNRLSDGRIAMAEGGMNIHWSSDAGATWGEPIHAGDMGSVPCSNHFVELPHGDLLVTTRSHVAPGEPVKKCVMQYRSGDQGKSWEAPHIIAEDPNLNLTEPSTIRLKDGRLLCVIRENSYNFFPSYKIVSEDNGQTWSDLQEMPLFGHEQYLGQLQNGKIMVAYRHVGGYAATLAWVGDPDEQVGFQVPATLKARTSPELHDGLLKVRTEGKGETVLYHLHPPECAESIIRLEAELRCPANRKHACGIHIAQAGWVAFYPDRVELPDCGGVSVPIDATAFHRYTILRDEKEMVVSIDGRELLRTDQLQRGKVVHNVGGYIRFGNVNAFGTQSPFVGSLEAEAEGEAHWRSVRLTIENPRHPRHEYAWDASSGKLPNGYEMERMIEMENNYGGSMYFVGQVAWVQFPDGEVYGMTGRQYLREDGRRSSWLRGCLLYEEDFGD